MSEDGKKKVSMPGDIDLDYRADNVILDKVVRTQDPKAGTLNMDLFFVEGENFGAGMLTANGWDVMEKLNDLKLSFGFHQIPEHMFEELNWADEIEFALVGWKDEKTLLKVVSSPGGTYTIYENDERWIPLPRVSNG